MGLHFAQDYPIRNKAKSFIRIENGKKARIFGTSHFSNKFNTNWKNSNTEVCKAEVEKKNKQHKEREDKFNTKGK